VIVANPRRVRLIAESSLKNDRVDAEVLARLVRMDPQLLGPTQPRSEEAQLTRGQLKVRGALVLNVTVRCSVPIVGSTTGSGRTGTMNVMPLSRGFVSRFRAFGV